MAAVLAVMKVAGIAILVLAGLCLLILMLLLFVPFCYEAKGSVSGGKPAGQADLRWFFSFLHANVKYSEEGRGSMTLRVLGIKVMETAVGKSGAEPDKPDRRDVSVQPEISRPEDEPERPEVSEEKPQHPKMQAHAPESADRDVYSISNELSGPKESGGGKKTSIPERILKLLRLMKRSFAKKYREIKENTGEFYERAGNIAEFINNDENRSTFLMIFRQAGRVLKEMLPRKGSGTVRFGTGDPYLTARMLEPLSVLFPLYGSAVVIQPLFDEETFSADMNGSGFFFLAVIVWCALRVWFSKRARKLFKEIKEL